MTTDEFVSLLTDAGNAYSIVKHDKRNTIHFRDRGYEFIGIPYDDDPEFLHIKTIVPAPEVLLSVENVRSILLQLEEEYRIVKLRCFESDDGKSQIEVGAEQFEANVESARGIFFRTLDLLVDSARECLRRLSSHPESRTIEAMPDRVLDTKKLLRAACLEAMNQQYNDIDTKIRTSLALAMNSSGMGTAFCVASSVDWSIYITNAHVVEEDKTISLYQQWPEYTKMLGTVVSKGDVEKTDLAIVRVPVGNVPAVFMSASNPAIDVTISLAGYPRVQKFAAESFGELYPAIHRGTVTAIARHGAVVMHDALSRPGNSGGPLYDPVDGQVYGVEAAGWESDEESIAISTIAVRAFLKEHDIAI